MIDHIEIKRINSVGVTQVREWFERATTEEIVKFLDAGLEQLIEELEEDDFFGTEGFNKRFA